MANYHFEVSIVSRGKSKSIASAISYISGKKIQDRYNDKTYYKYRDDVLYSKIFLPENSPERFQDLQTLCNEINQAEVRYDARTAKIFKASLPNELELSELIKIVEKFIHKNFTDYGLCAIAAIHEGKNTKEPSKNNPHVHIVVTTRTVGPDGFSKLKYRELDNKKFIEIWREDWANEQNKAYERNHLPMRVSHYSLEVQGIKDHEPTKHLTRIDWQKELAGIRTKAGDERRARETRNKQISMERSITLERSLDRNLSR